MMNDNLLVELNFLKEFRKNIFKQTVAFNKSRQFYYPTCISLKSVSLKNKNCNTIFVSYILTMNVTDRFRKKRSNN